MMNRSNRKATAVTINSQVCSGRKGMACPTVLKMKLTIEPMRLGKLDAVFCQSPSDLFPCPCQVFFRAFVIAPITASMTVPAARTVAVTVMPNFLRISLMRSSSESPSSRRSFSLTSGSCCCIFSQHFHELFNGQRMFYFRHLQFPELVGFLCQVQNLILGIWDLSLLSIFREKCSFASFKANKHKFSFWNFFPY